MDNLARNAMLARQAGMSYGKWKAMQPIVQIVKPEIPEGWQKCDGCGVAFFSKRKKRFHDEVCRQRTYDKRKYEKKKQKKVKENVK